MNMKHKDYSKCKIQKRHKEVYLYNHFRKFYWRIDPKELDFWERIFKNPWRKFEQALGDKLFHIYSIKDYYRHLKPIVTYEDAVKYQEEENKKAQYAHEEYLAKEEIWED